MFFTANFMWVFFFPLASISSFGIVLVSLISFLFPAYDPSPLLQRSLFFPDVLLVLAFWSFIHLLLKFLTFFWESLNNASLPMPFRVSSKLCPWHPSSETSVLILGGAEKNKGNGNSSWELRGMGSPGLPGRMVSQGWLLGGFWWRKCYSIVLLLLQQDNRQNT